MAINYTFEDFEEAAKKAGLKDSFSEADLRLAQKNPNAGMSLLNYKIDYNNATTPEAKGLANHGAESIRQAEGGYTGGSDGSGYYLYNPSYTDYQSKEAPAYDSSYRERSQQRLDEILDRPAFNYDPEKDPLYENYRNQYRREGERAMNDTLAQTSARTGGLASSYAGTAAQQANEYYGRQAADKIPELESIAYSRYLQEHQNNINDYGLLSGEENNNYTRYLNALSRYNTDRAFEYGRIQDAVAQKAQRDAAEQAAADRNYERRWAEAQVAASYGDLRKLEELGIEPSAENLYKLGSAAKGSAGSNGVGGGVSGTGGPGNDGGNNEKPLTHEDINKLTSHYGGYGIPQEDWNYYLSQGYTEQQLRDAGFYVAEERGTDVETEEVGEVDEFGFPLLRSGVGAEGIIRQAQTFVGAHPDIAWNSRTLDGYLNRHGLTPEEKQWFKEYVKKYGSELNYGRPAATSNTGETRITNSTRMVGGQEIVDVDGHPLTMDALLEYVATDKIEANYNIGKNEVTFNITPGADLDN